MENRQVELLSNIVDLLKEGNKQSRRTGGSIGSFSADDLKKVSEAFAKIPESVEKTKEEIRDIPNVVKDASRQMAEYGKALGGIKVASQQIDKFSGGLLGKLFDATGVKKLTGSVFNIAKGFREWSSALESAKGFGEKLLVSIDGASSLVGGLLKTTASLIGSALKGILAIGSGITKFIVGSLTSVLTLTTKISKFLVTLPVGIVNRASDLGNKLRQELVEVIGQAAEDTKEYFDLLSNGGSSMTQLRSIAEGSLLTFQSVDSNLTKLFGFGASGAAKMIGEVSKGIVDMGIFADVFADSTTKSAKSIEFFTRMTKGMGMASDDIAYVMRDAIKNGEHYFETMTRMKEASDEASYEFGVNRKILSKNFFQLRKDITNFGHLSEIELMKVTAKATQMGVEMKDVAGIFNKFGTFEDAANSAALLSQTFGMNIDALQLIRAEDPMEIVEMFRNSMLATGRSFEDLNRHEKSLMASHTGMSAETLKTVMNYRTLGKSFEDIKQIMNDQKPEERQIKAMNAMASSMSEVQKIMEKKDFFTSFLDGLTNTVLYGTQLGDSFKNVSKNMQNFYETGLRVDKKDLDKILSPFAKVVNEINEAFSIESLKSLSVEITKNLGEFVNDILQWDKCIKPEYWRKTQKKWDDKISGLFSLENLTKSSGFLGKLTRASGKLFGYIIKAFALAGPGIVKGFGKAFEGLVDWLSGGKISDMININTLANFLGMGEKECNELIERVTASFKSIKDYLFGYESKDGMGPKALGLFDRLGKKFRSIFNIGDDKSIFSGLKDSLLNSIKEMSESKVFEDSFSTIGEYIIKGMSKASKAIGKIVDSIMTSIQSWLVKNKYISKPAVKYKKDNKIGKNLGTTGEAKTLPKTKLERSLDALDSRRGDIVDRVSAPFVSDKNSDVSRSMIGGKTVLESAAVPGSYALAKTGANISLKPVSSGVKLMGQVGGSAKASGWLLKGLGAGAKIFGGAASVVVDAFLASVNIQQTANYLEHLVASGALSPDESKKIFDKAVTDQWTNTKIALAAAGIAVVGVTASTWGGGAIISGATATAGNYIGSKGASLAGYETAQDSMKSSLDKIKDPEKRNKIRLAEDVLRRQTAAYGVHEMLGEYYGGDEGFRLLTPTGEKGSSRNISSLYNRKISRVMRSKTPDGELLKKIAAMGGVTGQDNLDRDDIEALVSSAKEGNENSKALMNLLNIYLERLSTTGDVIVTMDGYALTSHITDIQQRQANNKSLVQGTSTIPGASQTTTLTPKQP